jgi:hypothetical protein
MAGLYPSPILSDKRWERVITVLERSGTKLDMTIAANLQRQVLTTRRRRLQLDAHRPAVSRAGTT